MKQKIQHFMMGRYGADQYGRLLMGISLVFLVISMFTRLDIFYILALSYGSTLLPIDTAS